VIAIAVANTGNAHLKPAGDLQVRDRTGVVVSRAPISMDTVYAHTDTKVEVTLAKQLLPGAYTVSLTLKYPTYGTSATADNVALAVTKTAAAAGTVGRSANLPQVDQSAPVAGQPKTLIVGLAVTALAAVAFTAWRWRRRKTRSAFVHGTPSAADQHPTSTPAGQILPPAPSHRRGHRRASPPAGRHRLA
jgi:hypothetical protein